MANRNSLLLVDIDSLRSNLGVQVTLSKSSATSDSPKSVSSADALRNDFSLNLILYTRADVVD